MQHCAHVDSGVSKAARVDAGIRRTGGLAPRLWVGAESQACCRPCSQPPLSLSALDVKFISNPPSMVAAGSVVAAMQGLNLGSPNNFLSCYRTTHFLSRVIKCDPVSLIKGDWQGPGNLGGSAKALCDWAGAEGCQTWAQKQPLPRLKVWEASRSHGSQRHRGLWCGDSAPVMCIGVVAFKLRPGPTTIGPYLPQCVDFRG